MPSGASQHLVFAARRAPYPLDNGARIRTNRILTGLSEAFETTLVCFEHHPDSPDGHCGRDELARLFPATDVTTVPGLGPQKRLGQAASLLSARSWTSGRYRLPAFGAALDAVVAERRPCIVHFDDLGVASFGPARGAFNVFAPPDVEHHITRRMARTGSPSRRAYNAVEWRKLRAEERRVWRAMDLCLGVSELDAEAMRAGGAREVGRLPNGTDPVEALPQQPLAPGEALGIVFVGSGNYAPYERGLAWFIREVLPLVRRSVPAHLAVVGRPPRRPIQVEGVDYAGRVPSVEPWYEGSHAVIVPVFEGSGTRLKVIEAMAYGRPVVSTALGAQGLPVRSPEHYLQADEPEAFARALVDLAASYRDAGSGLQSMLARARAAITPLFWPSIVGELVERYRTELAALSGGAARRSPSATADRQG